MRPFHIWRHLSDTNRNCNLWINGVHFVMSTTCIGFIYVKWSSVIILDSRSQWPRGLRCGSAADRLLELQVRNLPEGALVSVCCVCCVMSGRGLCNGAFIRPEKSYRVWLVVMCDLETSWMRGPWPTGGRGCCFAK